MQKLAEKNPKSTVNTIVPYMSQDVQPMAGATQDVAEQIILSECAEVQAED